MAETRQDAAPQAASTTRPSLVKGVFWGAMGTMSLVLAADAALDRLEQVTNQRIADARAAGIQEGSETGEERGYQMAVCDVVVLGALGPLPTTAEFDENTDLGAMKARAVEQIGEAADECD